MRHDNKKMQNDVDLLLFFFFCFEQQRNVDETKTTHEVPVGISKCMLVGNSLVVKFHRLYIINGAFVY